MSRKHVDHVVIQEVHNSTRRIESDTPLRPEIVAEMVFGGSEEIGCENSHPLDTMEEFIVRDVCSVCSAPDTGADPCPCIICDFCATRTHDSQLVVGPSPHEGMYCSAQCATAGVREVK